MIIITIICMILSAIFGTFGIWLLIRTDNVLNFREDINHKCKKWSLAHVCDDDFESAYDWCYNTLPSFNKMVHSFKPLKLKYWLVEDVIKKLESC